MPLLWPIISIVATAAVTILSLCLIPGPWSLLKTGIAIVAVLVLIAQGFVIRARQREKNVSRYEGILEGKPITVLSAEQQVYPKLELGKSGAILEWKGDKGKPIFKFFEDSAITIWIDGGRLRLSTKIRNSSGKMIAELVGNEWKVKPETSWDRNYSDSALEVIDEAGDVVLQVVLKEDVVQFSAKMYSSDGRGAAIGSFRRAKREVVGIMEFKFAGQPELELYIEPMFKYPSSLHLGELK